jgi:hypothetical protein
VSAPADYLAENLYRLIDKALGEHTGNLATGVAQTFDDYRFRCGVIRGLNEARALLAKVADPLIKDLPEEP